MCIYHELTKGFIYSDRTKLNSFLYLIFPKLLKNSLRSSYLLKTIKINYSTRSTGQLFIDHNQSKKEPKTQGISCKISFIF